MMLVWAFCTIALRLIISNIMSLHLARRGRPRYVHALRFFDDERELSRTDSRDHPLKHVHIK
jgi:hypothetical protein